MNTLFGRRTGWLPYVLLALSNLLMCGGCENGQQTATSQQEPSASTPLPPSPPSVQPASPQFNQPSAAASSVQPDRGTAAIGGSPLGPSGNAGQPGTMPAQGVGAVSAADSQSHAIAPADLAPAADTLPSGPPVEGFDIGNIAPEIDGEDVGGEVFRLSEYRGQVVMLDFWGDW